MTVQEILNSTSEVFWAWWLSTSPYERPKQKPKFSQKMYISEHIIGVNGVRKSLWFTCVNCEHCNGVLFEDEKHEDYHVSADCKFNGRDIIKDKDFVRCPLDKWVIKRPAWVRQANSTVNSYG